MTLRKKILLIIGVMIGGLIVILYAASRIILLGSFARLEEQNTRQNIERVLAALSDELVNLESTTGDWAAWDDTYSFVEGTYDDYVADNLMDSTFANLGINLMVFVRSSGELVFAKAFDLENETEIPVPQSLHEHLDAGSPLVGHPDTESRARGIVLLPEGPMLMASWPVLTSIQEGPIHGALIIGRYIDAAEIKYLAEQTRLSLTTRRFGDAQMPPDFEIARSSLSEETPIFIQQLSGESVAGYALLRDIYGDPALVLRVDMPREIYKRGLTSIFYFVLSLLTVALVIFAVIALLLERQVINRLTRISTNVSNIGTSSDLAARVTVTGSDELASLARAINRMLDALQHSEAKLEESNQALARRARYLEATAAVAHDATSVLEPEQLLAHVTTLISERIGFYHTGIFLLDKAREYAMLRAASSDGGQRMLARGHRLRTGEQGIVGHVAASGQPRIALDVGADAVFFDNPDLPDTRSEMALPLRARGEIIGVLDAQSTEPAAFSDEDVAVLQTLADQVAVAISNADLFQRAQESLETAQRAYGTVSHQAWAAVMRASTGWGYHYDEGRVLPLAEHLQSQDKQGADSDELPELTLPIRVHGHVIGTVNAHKPDGSDEWTPEDVTLMETMAEQLGAALESARLYKDTQRRAAREQLTSEVTARIRASLDIETVLRNATREIAQALGLAALDVRLGTEPEDGGE